MTGKGARKHIFALIFWFFCIKTKEHKEKKLKE